jgi:predicted Zn-ribbon and HTH transcriptional regulator
MHHGFIDMVVMDRDTGFVYFFEHKTCKDFRPAIYDRFDIQLHIYAQYGVLEYGDSFGGMILNQVKKAKTERGYDSSRGTFTTDEEELNDFFKWIKVKTEGIVSPNNMHEPCNNYMNCKMCEYADICLKYGYKLPKSKEEIIDNPDFVIEEIDPETNESVKVPQFKYEPRDSKEED